MIDSSSRVSTPASRSLPTARVSRDFGTWGIVVDHSIDNVEANVADEVNFEEGLESKNPRLSASAARAALGIPVYHVTNLCTIWK